MFLQSILFVYTSFHTWQATLQELRRKHGHAFNAVVFDPQCFNVMTTSYIATSLCEHKATSSFINCAPLCLQYVMYRVLAASAGAVLWLLVPEMTRSTYSVVNRFKFVTSSM